MIVGVNEFVTDEPELTHPDSQSRRETPSGRSASAWRRCAPSAISAACDEALERLREAARGTENVFPYILECARRYCTLYEIRAALEDVFGAYREPVFF